MDSNRSPDDGRRSDAHIAPSSSSPRADPAAGDGFHQLGTDLAVLLSTQIDIAKLEIRDEFVRGIRAARSAAVGAALACLAVVLLSFALALAVGDALHSAALGFAVVGTTCAVGVALVVPVGRFFRRR
jgi:uncharacterized membrane protein YqjE